MKSILTIILFMATTSAFANTPTSRGASSKSTGRTVASSESIANIFNPYEKVGSAEKNLHFMTNVAGLFNGKTNVQGNFFGFPQLALSVGFSDSSEKDEPIKKSVFEPGVKVAVTTTQFGVGAAYYLWPVNQKYNVVLNPYLVNERRSDPINVDNSTGLGLKADGMMRMEAFAFNLGAQYTSAGSTSTLVNAAVGYLF